MKKVLITGGAGYKGVLLTEHLLKEKCEITIMDNFMYGFEPVLGFASDSHCHIIKKDIRNLKEEDVKDFDVIYHLAAISGYPACEANPHSAQTINVQATSDLVKYLSKDQVLIYASTSSLYGRSDTIIDESTVPLPVSLYGKTKYEAEKICMEHNNAISFRFATLFGISRKMRTDLLLNDFVYKAVTDRSIVLFDASSIRTFLHVTDAITAYVMAFQNPDKMIGNIYNVGSNSMNYSKLALAEKIKDILPETEIIQTQLADPDERNLNINYDKISVLGYKMSITLDQGLQELVELYSWFRTYSTYRTI